MVAMVALSPEEALAAMGVVVEKRKATASGSKKKMPASAAAASLRPCSRPPKEVQSSESETKSVAVVKPEKKHKRKMKKTTYENYYKNYKSRTGQ